MRSKLILLGLGLGLCHQAVAGSPLLNRAAATWLAEDDHWAFTVRVRQFDKAEVKEVRVERFDPSRPRGERWQLLTVDGRAPTEERRLAWRESKLKKRRPAPLAEYFDFENARVASATPQTISYLLPLRSRHAVLLPLDHIVLNVMVNRATHVIEQVKAGIDEPFHTALGLARIIELDFDLKIYPPLPPDAAAGPATARPTGPAHMVYARLGERIEYDWGEFQRVTPAVESGPAQKPES